MPLISHRACRFLTASSSRFRSSPKPATAASAPREALGTKDLTFGWGGRAPALPGPGLGVDVDPAALERVTVRKETLL